MRDPRLQAVAAADAEVELLPRELLTCEVADAGGELVHAAADEHQLDDRLVAEDPPPVKFELPPQVAAGHVIQIRHGLGDLGVQPVVMNVRPWSAGLEETHVVEKSAGVTMGGGADEGGEFFQQALLGLIAAAGLVDLHVGAAAVHHVHAPDQIVGRPEDRPVRDHAIVTLAKVHQGVHASRDLDRAAVGIAPRPAVGPIKAACRGRHDRDSSASRAYPSASSIPPQTSATCRRRTSWPKLSELIHRLLPSITSASRSRRIR